MALTPWTSDITQTTARYNWGPQPPPTVGGVWNPDDKSTNILLSNDNKTFERAAGTGWVGVRSVNGKNTGKWYAELRLDALACGGGSLMLGLVRADAPLTYPGESTYGVGVQAICTSHFNRYYNSINTILFAGTNFNLNPGDAYMIAVNCDEGGIYVGSKGSWSADTPGYPGFTSIPAGTELFLMGATWQPGFVATLPETPQYPIPDGYSYWSS
jgi:hypothetical protein